MFVVLVMSFCKFYDAKARSFNTSGKVFCNLGLRRLCQHNFLHNILAKHSCNRNVSICIPKSEYTLIKQSIYLLKSIKFAGIVEII